MPAPDQIFTMSSKPYKVHTRHDRIHLLRRADRITEDRCGGYGRAVRPGNTAVVHRVIARFANPAANGWRSKARRSVCPGQKVAADNERPAGRATLSAIRRKPEMRLSPGQAKLIQDRIRPHISDTLHGERKRRRRYKTSVGIIFAKQRPARACDDVPDHQPYFRTPAGASDHPVKCGTDVQRRRACG